MEDIPVRRRTNLLGRVDGRSKVLEQATLLGTLIVDQDFESLIGVDDQGVKGGGLGDLGGRGVLQVLLLPLASDRVLVTEDEVYLVGCATFVLYVVRCVP
jgi:hypothetical protein